MPPAQNQPDFPAPTQQQPQHDPYDFFMAPAKPSKKKLLGAPSGMGMGPKLLLVISAVVLVIIIAVVLFSVLFGGKDTTAPLVSIASDQEELIRVSKAGSDVVNSTSLKNFAVTAEASLTSAQKSLLGYIALSGKTVATKQLATTGSAKTDLALKSSQASNTYDVTFTTIMQTGLTSYLAKLEAAAHTATNKTEQQLLEKQAAEAKLLIQQLTDE